MEDYTLHKITISQWVQDDWHESFKVETTMKTQTVRDIVTVFLGMGTERERELEALLKEKDK